MTEPGNEEAKKGILREDLEVPRIVDRSTFQAELDAVWAKYSNAVMGHGFL